MKKPGMMYSAYSSLSGLVINQAWHECWNVRTDPGILELTPVSKDQMASYKQWDVSVKTKKPLLTGGANTRKGKIE